MSGHKHATVCINQEDFRRLNEIEMKLRFLENGMPGMAEEIAQRASTELSHFFQGSEDRQKQLVNHIEAINQDIGAYEAQTNQFVINHQNQMVDFISTISNQLWDQSENISQELSINLSQAFLTIQEKHESDLSNLSAKINEIGENRSAKKEIAKVWIYSAEALNTYLFENFLANDLDAKNIKQAQVRIDQAIQNIENDLPEAAIAQSQSAYVELSNIRINMEKRKEQLQLLFMNSELILLKLLEEIDQNEHCPVLDLDGQILPYEINVDFWVNGALFALRDKLINIRENLLAGNLNSLKLLNKLVRRILPDIKTQIEEMVYRARVEVINSQLRMNIADTVVKALFNQGYYLQETNYQSQDMRDSYYARMINYEGNQILVRVDPGEIPQGKNELHLFADDTEQKTAHEIRLRSLEIQKAIENTGLTIGQLKPEVKRPTLIHQQKPHKMLSQIHY